MAFTLNSVYSTQLREQRLGYISISLDSWTVDNTVIPFITAGSAFEIGDSIYTCGADLTIDGDGTLAASANSTLYYVYADPTSLIFVTSATAPTWNDEAQNWQASIGGHVSRCLCSIYKDASGNYTRKNILFDRTSLNFEKSYQKNTITGTIDCYNINTIGVLVVSKAVTGAGVTDNQYFYLKKPISAFLKIVPTNAAASGGLYLSQNGASNLACVGVDGSNNIISTNIGAISSTTYVYSLNLCPGYYRLYTLASSGTTTSYLYCTGVYGDSSITIADIVTLA